MVPGRPPPADARRARISESTCFSIDDKLRAESLFTTVLSEQKFRGASIWTCVTFPDRIARDSRGPIFELPVYGGSMRAGGYNRHENRIDPFNLRLASLSARTEMGPLDWFFLKISVRSQNVEGPWRRRSDAPRDKPSIYCRVWPNAHGAVSRQ